MGNASVVKIAWTAIAAIGVTATLLLLVLALIDLLAVLRSKINGYRRRYARKLLREAAKDLGMLICMLAIGISALHTPPPIREINQRAALLNGSILIVANLWLTGHAIWSLIDEYWVRLRLFAEDRAWYKKH